MISSLQNPLSFTRHADAFLLASATAPVPIIYSADSPDAIVIAVNTFAEDIERVTGRKPDVIRGVGDNNYEDAILVGTVTSELVRQLRGGDLDPWNELEGKWEAWDVRTTGNTAVCTANRLIVTGSDRRGVIFALYTLSSLMGVSPWYWWADVPVTKRDCVFFASADVLSHGEPTVKYRGFFLNDEQPVLWNWAREHYKIPADQPPFQTGIYEKMFELCLRLRGNYMWPAMWASMFAVDGLDVTHGLPSKPTPGPNQALAERMGIVMGTSHHEPMSRNQKEYTDFGKGEWNYVSNGEWLRKFWTYGVERVKAGGCESVLTVGMRGDGDLPMGDANVELLERITADQQEILRSTFAKGDLSDVPQMWAMYKEVMGFFANGLKVPEDVTPLLADDNWGNLQAVMPPGKGHRAGGGIYYHADYVGDPRSYKWINTVSLAKMWEQLNVARSFDTTQIWILNVGDMKMLETPLEWFMDIAYDSDRWGRSSLLEWATLKAKRDFALSGKDAVTVGRIVAEYSMLASRRKAELLDVETYSLITFNETERVLAQWTALQEKAEAMHASLEESRKIPFYEIVLTPVRLQANLHRMYASAAKSKLYATQGRSAANLHAHKTIELFSRDQDLTDEFHGILGGKWNHMLSQPHIGYSYWQDPSRQIAPPVSLVPSNISYIDHGRKTGVRYTVEDCKGAWPGDNQYNNPPLGYNAPDPTLKVMDRYGRKRWVDVGSGGPESVEWAATPKEEWLIVEPKSGRLRGDGSNDTRVWIELDWDKVDKGAKAGHVEFTSSDETKVVTITLPIFHAEKPPSTFCGAVQGDRYVAIEAAHHQATHATALEGQKYSWQEIPFYGRSLSGMGVFPAGDFLFAPGQGPSLRYDFWLTTAIPEQVEVVLHIGPALNYILGKKLAVAIQLDDTPPVTVEPVPESPLGSLPADWELVVANEVRHIKATFRFENRHVGAHSLTVWALTTGIIVERVLIDLGGIQDRGYSYLGPPESVLV